MVANDGKASAGNAVWLNDGHGVFTVSEQSPGSGTSMELGDVDGDGDLDAFVASWDDEPSTAWLNDGAGAFADSGQKLGSGGCFAVTMGDLDGDGDLDAIVAQLEANTIWLNDGLGAFADSGQRLGAGVTADVGLGDLDDDGDLDALTGGWDEPAKVWLNDGAGTFPDSGHDLSLAHIHIHGIALGDVDSDGDLDAFMAIASGDPNEVWLNNGDGSFSNSEQELRGPLAHAVSLGDLDGDGDLDAFTAHGDRWRGTENRVWLNDGAGHFTDSGLRLGDMYSFGVALGDLDGDRDLDAFVVNSELWRDSGGGITNEVWLNETASYGVITDLFYSTSTWIRAFEGPDYGAFFDIILTEDGNALAVGATNHLHVPPYSGDALFTKLTLKGDVLWERTSWPCLGGSRVHTPPSTGHKQP